MTHRFKIIVVKRRSHKSAILLNDELYEIPEDEKSSGIRTNAAAMFAHLAGTEIKSVLAHCDLSEGSDSIYSLLQIDPFFFESERGGNCLEEEIVQTAKGTAEAVRITLALIVWSNMQEKERFLQSPMSEYMRTCVFCNEMQEGEFGGRVNLSLNTIVRWPSSYCTNPDCLSHKIEKAIDPEYEIPEVAFEKRRKLVELGEILAKEDLLNDAVRKSIDN